LTEEKSLVMTYGALFFNLHAQIYTINQFI